MSLYVGMSHVVYAITGCGVELTTNVEVTNVELTTNDSMFPPEN